MRNISILLPVKLLGKTTRPPLKQYNVLKPSLHHYQTDIQCVSRQYWKILYLKFKLSNQKTLFVPRDNVIFHCISLNPTRTACAMEYILYFMATRVNISANPPRSGCINDNYSR